VRWETAWMNTPNPKSTHQIGRLQSDNLKQHSNYTGFADSTMRLRTGKNWRYNLSMSKIWMVAPEGIAGILISDADAGMRLYKSEIILPVNQMW
jgi:hypothetical protein